MIDKSGPDIAAIHVPSTRDEIEAFAEEKFSVAHDHIVERFPEKQNQVLNQVRTKGNVGGYAPALTKLATERVREMILAMADAYVEAFTICGAPSDERAESTIRRTAKEFVAGALSAIEGQLQLSATRTRQPKVLAPTGRAMQIAVNSAIKEGVLRLKSQRLKFKTPASPTAENGIAGSAAKPVSRPNEQPTKRKRGRPQEIADEKKVAAEKLKAAGGTNKDAAALLYDTKYPTNQQKKNVPSILRHHLQKSKPSGTAGKSRKASPKPNKGRG
jgi:hypothetical protein